MKNTNLLTKSFRLYSAVALAAAALAWIPGSARAADQMKGGERMMNMNHIKTTAEAEALKPGDSMAMVCTMCKSVTVHTVTTEKGHIKIMTVGEKHLCPGCGTMMTVVGVGKGAKDEVKHVCEKCGDNSMFCCATKPGGAATPGMDKQ